MNPKISVIIPFFNAEKTLPRAMESILIQEGVDWELILVNDGSRDNSEELVKSFLFDSRIFYFKQKNKGVCAARNLGSFKAKGDWLIFLDSDDEIEKSLFNILADSISQDYEVLLWGFHWVFPNGNSKSLIRNDDKYIPILSGTFAIKRDVFHTAGRYDENLKFGENTELFHRIMLAGLSVKKLPIIGMTYYDSSTGGSKNLQNSIDSNLAILKKHEKTLSKHTKHLYHQVIGVNQLRFRRFKEARNHLWTAYILKPFKISTLIRFLISLFPIIATRLYSETVK
ncbi:MAG: glycosyltransferase [Cytophagia bacterium]|nr:glycosyltransferase [Cytophagia bacterium]